MRQRLLDLRAAARDGIDTASWHYLARGADADVSVDEAEAAWRRYRLLPHALRDVSQVSTALDLFGSWRAPIGIAPTAFHALLTGDGELATASAAAASGLPMVLSTRATRRLEDVAARIAGPWWFQVYVMQDRSVTQALVRRAVAAGASALVFTADTPYVGYRAPTPELARPVPLSQDDLLVNVRDHLAADTTDVWASIDQRADQTAAEIGWLAELSGLPVIVKGILRADDAEACVAAGASGIWVSNHGGRQLDRALSTAAALPRVVATVGDRVPVLADGGVRSGTDALVALALGARAVFVGRPVMWGLAAAGSGGAQEVLDEIVLELRHAMGLAGAARLTDLAADLVLADGSY